MDIEEAFTRRRMLLVFSTLPFVNIDSVCLFTMLKFTFIIPFFFFFLRVGGILQLVITISLQNALKKRFNLTS